MFFKKIIVYIFFLFLIVLASSSIIGKNSNKEIDSLLKLIKLSKFDTSYVKNLNLLSTKYFSVGEYTQAMDFAKKAQQKAEALNYRQGAVNAIINCSNINLGLANYDTVIVLSNNALSIVDSLVDKFEMASIFNVLGVAYIKKGSFEKALVYYFKSQRLSELINNKKGLGITTMNIAAIYKLQGNVDKALEYSLKALKFNLDANNQIAIAANYNNIGTIYKEVNNSPKALYYYSKAIEIREKIGDKKGLATTLNNLADIYAKEKDYSSALLNYGKALAIRKEIADRYGLAESYLSIGLFYISKNNLPGADKYLKDALSIAVKIGHKEMIKIIYLTLAQLTEKRADYKQALLYQKLHTAIKDTLFNSESNRQMTEMNTKYETELKDKELIKKDAEIALQLANSKKQAIIRNGFLVGFVFLLGLIIFVYRSYVQKQKINKLLNDKNQKITNSINYAKLIQSSILPSQEDLQKHLPNSFVFYQPKDIVSGDFYWLYPLDEKSLFFAVIDCTGHGVPGAMMSMLGYSLLEQIVNQNKQLSPATILDQLNHLVLESLKQSNNTDAVKTGMDMALLKLDYGTCELQYAGAKNPLYIVRDQNVIELKADRKSIGLSNGSKEPFTNQIVQLQQGDELYAFSDGYIDQKGGAENKKYYSSNFQKLLISINALSATEQQIQIEQAFTNWKGSKEQMDDVLVFGMKV